MLLSLLLLLSCSLELHEHLLLVLDEVTRVLKVGEFMQLRSVHDAGCARDRVGRR